MLTSTAVQIMLLFGVIIASGLLLTLVNDLFIGLVSVRARGARASRKRRTFGLAYTGVASSRKSYATVNALRIPATLPPKTATADSDFKVITVRMRNSAAVETELSKAA